jgi:hypothetical protein
VKKDFISFQSGARSSSFAKDCSLLGGLPVSPGRRASRENIVDVRKSAVKGRRRLAGTLLVTRIRCSVISRKTT